MPTTQRFFANITSHRDNGAPIELNLRGTAYIDPGNRYGPPESCREPESEINITQCQTLTPKMSAGFFMALVVDFYEFTITEQERFIEAALQNMEADD